MPATCVPCVKAGQRQVFVERARLIGLQLAHRLLELPCFLGVERGPQIEAALDQAFQLRPT
jgi:hypothetical protein